MQRLRFAVAAIAIVLSGAAAAQSYPVKPVRIIVPFPPGGGVDQVARVLAQRLTEQMGQQVLVENRAGANGAIGSDAVAKAAPDGYTLLFQAPTFITNPLFVKTIPYDVHKDFTPITNLGSVPLVMAAHPAMAAQNLSEFLAQARLNGSRFTFGSPPLGSPGHMALEAVRHQAKINVRLVNYKGTAPVLTDLLGGHISATIDAMPAYISHVKAGKLRALAVTSTKRVAALPDVPTVAESGLPGFDMVSWYGLWGPAKLPAELVRRLADESVRAIRSREARERLTELAFEPLGSTPDELGRFVLAEQEKHARLIREAKITADTQ